MQELQIFIEKDNDWCMKDKSPIQNDPNSLTLMFFVCCVLGSDTWQKFWVILDFTVTFNFLID